MSKRWFGIALCFIGWVVRDACGLCIKTLHNNNTAAIYVTTPGGTSVSIGPRTSMELNADLEELAPAEGAREKLEVTSSLLIKTFVRLPQKKLDDFKRSRYVAVECRSYYLFLCRWQRTSPAVLMIVRQNDQRNWCSIKVAAGDDVVDLVIADYEGRAAEHGSGGELGVRLAAVGTFKYSEKKELCAKMMAQVPLSKYCKCPRCAATLLGDQEVL